MFENLSPEDQLSLYEEITTKANRLGKILGIGYVCLMAFVGLIVLLSGEAAGTILAVAALAVVGYFMLSLEGKGFIWARYWLRRKHGNDDPLWALALSFYVGISLQIKYRNYDKKIREQY